MCNFYNIILLLILCFTTCWRINLSIVLDTMSQIVKSEASGYLRFAHSLTLFVMESFFILISKQRSAIADTPGANMRT